MIHENLNLLPKNFKIFYTTLLTLIACESQIKKNPLAQMEERKNLSHIIKNSRYHKRPYRAKRYGYWSKNLQSILYGLSPIKR